VDNSSPRSPNTHPQCSKTAITMISAHNGMVIYLYWYKGMVANFFRYKDVISFNSENGHFVESFGGTHLLQKPLDKGTEAGTIEADEQHVRLLKDADAAIKKIWQEQDEAGFVVAHRQVSSASYKRAKLVDVGNNNWEVVREVGNEDASGKRRDSGLPVETTNSKWDVVGVVVRKIVIEGDDVKLGEELGAGYWN
jgi:hypothetical protein